MGLLGIEERVSYLGGTFLVESEPGRGATLSHRAARAAAVAQPVQALS